MDGVSDVDKFQDITNNLRQCEGMLFLVATFVWQPFWLPTFGRRSKGKQSKWLRGLSSTAPPSTRGMACACPTATRHSSPGGPPKVDCHWVGSLDFFGGGNQGFFN